MKERREEVIRHKIAFGTVVFLLIFAGAVSIFFGVSHTQAAAAEVSYKYYTSVLIDSGDTLWKIADTHLTDDYRDINAYIDEIRDINHILGDEIHAGQYLAIPYYSRQYLE